MTFNEYQRKARRTAVYPNIDANLDYPALGLAEEAGEVAGKNLEKLRDRAARDKIKGDGDNR
jgi:hypothetical protein